MYLAPSFEAIHNKDYSVVNTFKVGQLTFFLLNKINQKKKWSIFQLDKPP